MKHISFTLIILSLLISSCSLPTAVAEENAEELPPLYLGFSIHLEGWKVGNEKLGYDQDLYERYSDLILGYSNLANSYAMPFTWETANLIAPSANFEPNILVQLYQRGDGIGVHADLGGKSNAPGGQKKFTRDMKKMRLDMEAMGIPISHVSGICSTMDWVTAALDAGYEATTGTVEYCLKSLPLDEQSAAIRACESPATCHDAFPGEIPDLLHPYRAADGSTWTTPANEGLILFHAAGDIPCTATGCDIQMIEEALAAREPGIFHSLFFIHSFGSPMDEEILRTFYESIQPYIESGDIVWQTMPQLLETYKAVE